MPGKTSFSSLLLAWFDQHGRKSLPWQQDRTPYRVWVSEIMLQQTQVSTVIPYFTRFLQAFPTVESLANASPDTVMHLWTGLGYYSRARNLQRAAQQVTQDGHGQFPTTLDAWMQLPGIGRSTAGAILAIALNQRTPILDGNVKRVLTRVHAITTWPGDKATEAALWKIADRLTPADRVADYTQAIMDLGATVCVRGKPRCDECPLKQRCLGRKQAIASTLPRSKPREQPLPVKSATLLLIQKGHHVLLRKRPARGIWANLWSLPEIAGTPSRPTVRAHCERTLILRIQGKTTALTPFRHTFSHYHLDIHPILLQSAPHPRTLDSESEIWYNLQRPQALGLPAPVKKLLESLPCLD